MNISTWTETVYKPTPFATALDAALESFQVFDPSELDEGFNVGPKGWWAVANDDGIIAYFADESSACRFRLAEVNRVLNG